MWNKLNTTLPLAVVWPTSAEQVAAAVKCARSAGVQAVPRCAVRTGQDGLG